TRGVGGRGQVVRVQREGVMEARGGVGAGGVDRVGERHGGGHAHLGGPGGERGGRGDVEGRHVGALGGAEGGGGAVGEADGQLGGEGAVRRRPGEQAGAVDGGAGRGAVEAPGERVAERVGRGELHRQGAALGDRLVGNGRQGGRQERLAVVDVEHVPAGDRA